MKVMYAAESDYKLKQLAKQFGREKRVVVKYPVISNTYTYMTTERRQNILA